MPAPSVARLGHVGVFVNDLDAQKAFYRDIIGLQVTDENPAIGMVFMSARPEEEHHEFLLVKGRNVQDEDAFLIQQVSFRCNTLGDVIGYYQRFKQHQVRFDMVVSHGNAVGIYFRDPEGNRCEIYCGTGLNARQPYLEKVNLDESPDEIMRKIRESVAVHAADGIIDPSALDMQDINSEAVRN